MKDCDCKKSENQEEWLQDNEVGDSFLSQENEVSLISSIRNNLNRYQINSNAIFNRKLDEDELENLILDDTVLDYSYLKDFDDSDEDASEIMEETESETEIVDENDDVISEKPVDSDDDASEIMEETETETEIVDETEDEEPDTSKYLPVNNKKAAKTNASKYLRDLL